MITPIDIRKLDFTKSMRGYNPEDVRAALESIAKELEKQIKENTALKERLSVAEDKLKHFKLIEKTLQESVITMQTTLEEKKKAAEQEASLIIQEAKHNASGEYKQFKDHILSLKSEITSLESQKAKYFIRFKNFLMSQLDWLNTMEKDDEFNPADGTIDFHQEKQKSTPPARPQRPMQQRPTRNAS